MVASKKARARSSAERCCCSARLPGSRSAHHHEHQPALEGHALDLGLEGLAGELAGRSAGRCSPRGWRPLLGRRRRRRRASRAAQSPGSSGRPAPRPRGGRRLGRRAVRPHHAPAAVRQHAVGGELGEATKGLRPELVEERKGGGVLRRRGHRWARGTRSEETAGAPFPDAGPLRPPLPCRCARGRGWGQVPPVARPVRRSTPRRLAGAARRRADLAVVRGARGEGRGRRGRRTPSSRRAARCSPPFG